MRALLLLALLSPGLLAAEHWNIQYFYDKAREQLNIADLAFPSPQRGIAIGRIEEANPEKTPKPVVLTTSDGGANWTLSTLKDQPRSLFFLNDSTGWMVTDNGIWLTQESGRSWTKIGGQKNFAREPRNRNFPRPAGGLILRVWFLDEQHGFAVGYQKALLETHDGGRNWTPVAEGAKPNANPAYTVYTHIVFDGPRGLITGESLPPRRDASPYPAWMAPQLAVRERQVPNLTLELDTHDGGATWQSGTAPVFGIVSALRMAGPIGLDVMGFAESFEWPSEVYRIDLKTGASTRVFREKDRRVTDAALFPGPRAFLAAVEPTGRLNTVPVPGKIKMLSSTDLNGWKEMEVDYRAEATNVLLAGPDPDHLWAATDTGMILQLVK